MRPLRDEVMYSALTSSASFIFFQRKKVYVVGEAEGLSS